MPYLFVDGAYLHKSLEKWGLRWYGAPAELDPEKLSEGFEKTFYYDAPPVVAPDESSESFAERERKRHEYFNFLRSFPGWHVSEGISRRRGKGANRKVEQKEVDVLIAVEMLTHTHRRNTDRMSFITGDLDFRPLLEAVVREGMYLELLFDPSHISDELGQAADRRRPLDFFEMRRITHTWCKHRPTPHFREAWDRPAGIKDGHIAQVGRRSGVLQVEIWHRPSLDDAETFFAISTLPVNRKGQFAVWEHRHSDCELLKTVYEDYYGSQDWTDL